MPFPYRIHEYLRAMRGKKSASAGHLHVTPEKEYPRMKSIALPQPEIATPLSEALSRRTSAEAFNTERAIPLEQVGAVLGHSLRIHANNKRPYPSGGAHYPIETYLVARRIEGLEAGAYHYHPRAHSLEYLWNIPAEKKLLGIDEDGAAGFVIFTGIWLRSYQMYSDFSYFLGMLEAGHAAQNVLLSSAAVGLAARPFGGFDDKMLSEAFDVPPTEQVTYVVALGTAAPSRILRE